MNNDSNPNNEVSKLVEVHEEPVAKWRNLQVNIYPTFQRTPVAQNAENSHITYTVSIIVLLTQGTNLLQLMYEDPKRWSLMFQTYVQLTMLQQHTKTSAKPIHIMERSLLRHIFITTKLNT